MFTHLRLAGALSLALATSFLHGETLTLDPVTVTATRLEPTTDVLPTGAVVIGPEDLEHLPGDNLADALDAVAGVNGRRLYGIGDSGASVDLLGFGAAGTSNTLVLLNGRRLNTVDLAAVDFSVVPLSAIERIEVLPASGAVLYGSGAVGGAINIVTRANYTAGAELALRAGSHDTGGVRGSVSRGDETLSGLASARYLESDGYRDNNALEQWNLFTDLHGSRQRLSWSLAVLADRQETGLPGPRVVDPGAGINELEQDPRGTATPEDWAEQQGVHLMPGMRLAMNEGLDVQVDAGMRLREQESFLEGTFGFSSYTAAHTETWNLSPRLVGTARTGPAIHRWTLGMDLQRTVFEREAALDESTRQQPIHQVDIDQDLAAVYVLDTLEFGPDTSVTLGARHEWVSLDAEDDYDAAAPAPPCFSGTCDGEAAPLALDQDAGMYSLGLRQRLAGGLSFFLNLERSARYASVDEIFESKYDFLTNTTTYTLEPLEVQTGHMTSTGLSLRRRNVDAVLTLWTGRFENEIHFDPATFDNINLDPTRRQGMSLNSRWRATDSLSLTLNGALQLARFTEGQYDGKEVPLVPRQTLYARADWQARPWLGLSLAHRYVGKRYFDNDQQNDFGQRIPSYRATDLELRLENGEGLYFDLGVFNLEDRVEYDYGVASSFTPGRYNAYPLPERHIMATLGMKL